MHVLTSHECHCIWSNSHRQWMLKLKNMKIHTSHKMTNLDNNSMSWQVDTPGKGGSAHQHLNVSLAEQVLNHIPVTTKNKEVQRQKLLQSQRCYFYSL